LKIEDGIKSRNGLVHVITGDGKGKTTSALGLGLRAIGHGFKVYMIQFMKGKLSNEQYGEVNAVKKIRDFKIVQFGRRKFVDKRKPARIDVNFAHRGLEHAKKIIGEGKYDFVILDEINVAMDFGLLKLSDVLQLIKDKPKHVELVLTGRYAPKELLDVADYFTEVKEVKHPYQKGVTARKGVEYN